MLHVLKATGGSVQRRLRENAAISVGRLATVQPSALAVHLSHFLGDWCVTLATITVRFCALQTLQLHFHSPFIAWKGVYRREYCISSRLHPSFALLGHEQNDDYSL